jgi:CIC family chloride channel protein
VNENDTIDLLNETFTNSMYSSFPVLNDKNELIGIVSTQDMHKRTVRGKEQHVCDIMAADIFVGYPFETLDIVLDRMVVNDISLLPIVMKSNPKKMIGIVTRKDIMNAYNKSVLTKVQSIGEVHEEEFVEEEDKK